MTELTKEQQELLDLLGRLQEQGREGASAVFLNRRLGRGLEKVEADAKQLVKLEVLQARATKGGVVYILPEKSDGAGKPKTLAEIFEVRTRNEPQKIDSQLVEKFTAAGIILPEDWFSYLRSHESRLVFALQSLDLPVTIAADRYIEALDQEDQPDKLGVLIAGMLFLSRKTRTGDLALAPTPPPPVLSVSPFRGSELEVVVPEPVGTEVDGQVEVNDEREFADIRNRWEVLRILPAMREFIRYHDLNSIIGLVNRLGHYGTVAEAFAMAGGIEIAQPTAEEIREILPGLSKFQDRLELEPPDSIRLAAPPTSSVPQASPAPVASPIPPTTAKGETMPVMKQEPQANDPPKTKKPPKLDPEIGGYPTWERLQKSPGFGRLDYKRPGDFARDYQAAGCDPAALFRSKGKMGKGLGKTCELVRQYAIGAGLTATAGDSPEFSCPDEEKKYGIPTEHLFEGCGFLKSGAWRQFNNVGIRSITDLVKLIDKTGRSPEKVASEQGIKLHWNRTDPLSGLLPLFRQYSGQLDAITPAEARKIYDRIKWHRLEAKRRGGDKNATKRQAASKAAPAPPVKKESVPPAGAIQTVGEVSALAKGIASLSARAEFREAMGELYGVVRGLFPHISSFGVVEPLLSRVENNLAARSDLVNLDDDDRRIIEIARHLQDIHQTVIGK